MAKLQKKLCNGLNPSIFEQKLFQIYSLTIMLGFKILSMKFAIIKERKNPPDRRVVFSPETLDEARKRFPEAEFVIESSDIRVFSDEEYRNYGFEVTNDVSDADVMIGVKEVPLDFLVANKDYFFFSHTIKKQPYNRKLLKAILNNNIHIFNSRVKRICNYRYINTINIFI